MSVKLSLSILLLSLVTLVCHVAATPALSSDFIEQEKSCRDVCGLCNCDGFYCIDECICECSIRDEENLQCIADMKKECDRNGLEYELLMQESTKERFMRQIKSNPLPFAKFANNFVILKQKRDSSPSEAPPVADDEPIVAATGPKEKPRLIVQPGYEKPSPPPARGDSGSAKKPANNDDDEERVASTKDSIKFPLAIKAAAFDGKFIIAGIPNLAPGKLLFSMRDTVASPTTARPSFAQFSLPAKQAPPAPPSSIFSSLPSLSLPTFQGLLGKPAPETAKDGADEEQEEEE